MQNVSICLTLRNRANLLKWCLESITRQDCDLSKVEVCITDGGSTDNLLTTIDQFSEKLTFRFCVADRRKAYIPVASNCPANEINLATKFVATSDYIIKTDPEIVFRDPWVISEIVSCLERDDSCMYNARTHFTREDGWFSSYDDIIRDYEKHYVVAENSLFHRSKFYFCSGFSRQRFVEMGGVEELMGLGVGYDDTLYREVFRNRYGSYEKEITGQAIHLWHGANQSRSTWEVANSRIFDYLKYDVISNVVRLDGQGHLIRLPEPQWANPEMLSKIYTIKNGQITKVDDVNDGSSRELELPF